MPYPIFPNSKYCISNDIYGWCHSCFSCFHVFLCWVLVFKLGLGIKGAALANVISYWINFLLLVAYLKFSTAWMKTWTGFTKEAFRDIWSFIKLAIPSTFMICLEYWSFEMVVLLAGLLPNPQLETSVLSISTRVSNELGAGRPRAAPLALFVMVIMSLSQGIVIAAITVLVRNVWGKLYSKDDKLVKYVAKMMLLLAISDFLDGFQCVLSGAARGLGWQKMCSSINLGAYYMVALACAVVFAFVLHFRGMGRLWLGIIYMWGVYPSCGAWEKEGRKALARIGKNGAGS